MPDETPALPPAKETTLTEYVPSITVTGPSREKFIVPTTAAANRAYSQVIVSRLRAIMLKRLEEIEKSGTPPNDLEIARLSSTAEVIEGLAERAYAPGTKGMNSSSEFEDFAIKTVKAAASGAAEGKVFADKLAKMQQLGKVAKAKKVEPVTEGVLEIEPAQ